MATTHDPNIVVNIFLDPSPAQQAGFGTVLLLVPLSANSLNGVRVASYTSYEAAQTAQTAGYISATTLAELNVAFAQSPKPATVKVGYVDIVGGETYGTGLAACITYDPDFYGVCIQPRTDAEIVACATYVESASKKMLFAFQSDDASWLDSGIPAGLSAIDNYERTIACYHLSDAQYFDIAYMCNRLVYDPDELSATWTYAPLSSVTAYVTTPTEAQRLLCIANDGNLGLAFGGGTFVVDPGTTLNERPIYEIVTADWFATRLQERISTLAVSRASRGQKIIMDAGGQTLIQAEILALLKQGAQAGHFVTGQYTSTPETITTSDISSRKLRFTVRAQIATSARLVTFNCYFGRDAVVATT